MWRTPLPSCGCVSGVGWWPCARGELVAVAAWDCFAGGGAAHPDTRKGRRAQALQRAAILSNEKYRGIRFALKPNALMIQAHNPEQEEAEEEVEVSYDGEELEIGFNVNYLLDALAAVDGADVQVGLTDGNSSCLIRSAQDGSARYVVMPMRL